MSCSGTQHGEAIGDRAQDLMFNLQVHKAYTINYLNDRNVLLYYQFIIFIKHDKLQKKDLDPD